MYSRFLRVVSLLAVVGLWGRVVLCQQPDNQQEWLVYRTLVVEVQHNQRMAITRYYYKLILPKYYIQHVLTTAAPKSNSKEVSIIALWNHLSHHRSTLKQQAVNHLVHHMLHLCPTAYKTNQLFNRSRLCCVVRPHSKLIKRSPTTRATSAVQPMWLNQYCRHIALKRR